MTAIRVSPVQRVQRTQRSLSILMAIAVISWAVAAYYGLRLLGVALNSAIGLSTNVQLVLWLVAALGGVVTLGLLAWRHRFAWSFDRVALWIEERAPELRYALVTAIDPRYRESFGSVMEPIVSRVDTGRFVRNAATHTTLPAVAALVVATSIFMLLPQRYKNGPTGLPVFGGSGAHGPAVIGNRLVPLHATVTPPGYANRRTQSLDEPQTLSSLQGSRVVLTGKGTPDGIQVTLGDKAVPVTAGGKGWTAAFTMADSLPAALSLVDRQYHKTIVVDPIIDQPPTARLTLPIRDTTLRVINGTLHLAADFTDDVGLGKGQFEYIVSNMGDGDKAEARSGTFTVRTFGGGTTGSMSFDIPFKDINLKEGDMLSVRATVIDNNTLSGPGKGYSETRTIRIARKEEYDSISVRPAPPSADTAMMTLRMLIIATEKLEKERPTWIRKKFVDSALKLAAKSEIIRQTVQRIIDDQTGGGEIAVDPNLKIALDAMWEATRSLNIAETGEALPFLYKAYDALKKYSTAKRYYLRGKIQVQPINLDRIRLTGTDSVHAKARGTPRTVEGTEVERLRVQYTEAINAINTDPSHAMELFNLMRVATLRTNPPLAAALGDAVTALQRGSDVTFPLVRARRTLEGSAGAIDSLPAWSGAW